MQTFMQKKVIALTKEEVSQILTIIQIEYPNSFGKLDKRQMETKYELWCSEFAEDDFQSVFIALRMYLECGEEFAPNIGQLRKRMRMQLTQNEITEGEALSMVSKACRNGLYGYTIEYDKLPPDVQKAVGRPEQLRDWAMLDEADFQTVAGSHFLRSFRAVRERKKEIEMYSPSLREKIKKLQISNTKMEALPEEK